jgi:hypothetical protein
MLVLNFIFQALLLVHENVDQVLELIYLVILFTNLSHVWRHLA